MNEIKTDNFEKAIEFLHNHKRARVIFSKDGKENIIEVRGIWAHVNGKKTYNSRSDILELL